MFKRKVNGLIAALMLIGSVQVLAEDAADFEHKMLLMAGEQHLFASHIPQWEFPYNFQSFVEVKFDDEKTEQKIKKKLEKSKNYFTLVPKSLEKHDLKSGEPFKVQVKIFDQLNEQLNREIIAETEASMRSLFYRQIDKNEKKNHYSKYEKYYSVRSGSLTYLFNRVSPYRPFDHIVVADNQCKDYLDSLEVEMFKSKPQPSFSGSLGSLKEIAKKYDLSNLSTIYFSKDSLKKQ